MNSNVAGATCNEAFFILPGTCPFVNAAKTPTLSLTEAHASVRHQHAFLGLVAKARPAKKLV